MKHVKKLKMLKEKLTLIFGKKLLNFCIPDGLVIIISLVTSCVRNCTVSTLDKRLDLGSIVQEILVIGLI